MRGTVLLLGAILGTVLLFGAPASPASAALDPDDYSGPIQTECTISVPAHIDVGERVRITFRVDANSPTPPVGHVDLSVVKGGDVLWTKTVSYHGGTRTVVGPSFPKGPGYTAIARFRPSDDTFKGCHASDTFAVAAGKDHNDHDDHNGPGGLLPDTGGPALLWLLLGVGLVGGGAGTVTYARRRAPATV